MGQSISEERVISISWTEIWMGIKASLYKMQKRYMQDEKKKKKRLVTHLQQNRIKTFKANPSFSWEALYGKY